MNKNKTVSIIVPIYNVEKYVEKCINSIINQTYSSIEVILINDGSSDNSREIIEQYNSDSRFKIIDQKNEGLSSARNTGLENAKGDYIYFVDSDDYLHKDAIKLLVGKMEETDADFCCYRLWFYTEDNKRMFLHGKNFSIEILNDKNEIIKDAFLGINIKTSSWSKFYRRSFIEENNLRFERSIINEDCLFTITSAIYSKKVAFLNIPLYYALIRAGSISREIKKENITSYFSIYEKIMLLLKKEMIFNEYEKYFYASYFVHILNSLLQTCMKVSKRKYFFNLYQELNGSLYFENKYAKYIQYKSKYLYAVYLLSLFPSLFYYFSRFLKRINNRIY
jgi:glycosyltransferase involved in cell wall biosynthesis